MRQDSHHIARRTRRLSFIFTGTLCITVLGAHAAPKANKKVTPPASASPAPRMPRGAYLRQPVHSTPQLVGQFANDPLVVERYSRVFKMSPEAVKSALKEMRLTPLKKDMVMNVYYVRPGEHLGFRVRRVRKGTLVFTLPDGTPALVQACGNPLRHTLPSQKITKVPDFRVDEPLDAIPSEDLAAQDLPEETGATRMTPSVATAPPMITATPSSELEAAVEIATVAGAGSGAASGDFIEDIAALPLGFLGAGGGGSAAGGLLAAGLTKGLLIAGGAAALGNFVSNSSDTPSSNPNNPGNPTSPGGGGDGTPPPGGDTPPGGNPPGGTPPPGGDTPPGLVPEWNANLLFLFALAGAGVPALLRKSRRQSNSF